MSKTSDQLAASLQLSTRLVWGEGQWARISRCAGGSPLVHLHATREECDRIAALGKRCGQDCRGAQHHTTEHINPLRDEVPVELGYHEKRMQA
jgi:hypothetical protein